MKAVIRIKNGDDITIIKYKSNVSKIYHQDLHLCVELQPGYDVDDKDKENIRNYNVSTVPYHHVFYNATIAAVYE